MNEFNDDLKLSEYFSDSYKKKVKDTLIHHYHAKTRKLEDHFQEVVDGFKRRLERAYIQDEGMTEEGLYLFNDYLKELETIIERLEIKANTYDMIALNIRRPFKTTNEMTKGLNFDLEEVQKPYSDSQQDYNISQQETQLTPEINLFNTYF